MKSKISDDGWYKMCETSTSSQRWMEGVLLEKSKSQKNPKVEGGQLSMQQPCWWMCGHVAADVTHIFWSCPKINMYWDMVVM